MIKAFRAIKEKIQSLLKRNKKEFSNSMLSALLSKNNINSYINNKYVKLVGLLMIAAYVYYTNDIVIPLFFGTVYFSSAIQIYNGTVNVLSQCKIDSTHIAVFYVQSGGTYLVIGTIASGSITFGTATQVTANATAERTSIALLDTSKLIMTWHQTAGSSNVVYVIVATLDGGYAITLGSSVNFTTNPSFTYQYGIDIDVLDSTRAILAYGNGTSQWPTVRVCSVSGTTITLETAVEITQDAGVNSGVGIKVSAGSDSVCSVAWQDKLVICTISGTTITKGTYQTYGGIGDPGKLALKMLSATLGIIAFAPSANNAKTYAFTVSGTTATLGSSTDWNANNAHNFASIAKISATEFLLTGDDTTASLRINKIGYVSGTTITFGGDTSSTNTTLQQTVVLSISQAVNVYRAASDNKLYAELLTLGADVSVPVMSPILGTSAVATASILYDSGASITRRGFCYMIGTSGEPTTANSTAYEDGSFTEGSYDVTLSGLNQFTSYRVRSYLVTADGTSYGPTTTFTTKRGLIYYTGFEGSVNSAGLDGIDSVAISPNVNNAGSVSTAQAHSGAQSFRVQKVSTTDYAARGNFRTINADGTQSSLSAQTIYVTFYMRYASKPASASEEILRINGDNPKFFLRLNSNGSLSIWEGSVTHDSATVPVQIGSNGATILTQDEWYRIDVAVGSGTNAIYEVRINNVVEFIGTRTYFDTGWNSQCYLGCVSNRNGQNYDIFFDDYVLRDDEFAGGPTLAIVNLHPVANGSSMSWSAGTGASNYTQVDETEYDDTDYVMTPSNGTNPNQALFTFQQNGDVGIGGTILAVRAQILTRENSSHTSNTFVRIKSGSTNSDSDARNGTTTLVGQQRQLITDPNTSAAWTIAALNAIEAGAVENNNGAVRLVNVSVAVLFITLEQKTYSKESKASLPTVKTDLAALYTSENYTQVETDDGVRVSVIGLTSQYAIHMFKSLNTNNTNSIEIEINVRSSVAPTSKTVYLQIWNVTSETWETLTSNNSAAASTDFTLIGQKTTSLSDYYDVLNEVTFRIYQQN